MNVQETYQTQVAWLLEGDPSIRYHTLRDLVKAPEHDLHHEQQKMLNEGWGKRLLDLQHDDGMWANALYAPKMDINLLYVAPLETVWHSSHSQH